MIHGILTESKEVALKPTLETLLDLESVPPLLLDRDKIAFALKQVIENAYKFSGEEGCVAISLHCAEEACRVVVSDSGPGMSREELPKIFEKFYQIDPSQTGQIRGFGLGLYYAREFVRHHGGAILVESEPGRGTKVTVNLPLAENAVPA
jgi:signal transduction histidine kinase